MYKYFKYFIIQALRMLLRRESIKSPCPTCKSSLINYLKDPASLVYVWRIFNKDIYMQINKESYIDKQILYNKKYSRNINFHIIKNVRSRSIYIDVGANVGSTSLPAAIAKLDLEVEAFEPNSEIYDQLSENIRLNKIQNIQIHDIAVGAKNEILSLNVPQAPTSNFGTASLLDNDDIKDPIQKEVIVAPLDQYYSERKKKVSVIKIDVQGFEYQVLLGASQIIDQDRPTIIFEHEDHYHTYPDEMKDSIFSFFDQRGYKIFEIDRYDYRRLREVRWDDMLNCNLIALSIRN